MPSRGTHAESCRFDNLSPEFLRKTVVSDPRLRFRALPRPHQERCIQPSRRHSMPEFRPSSNKKIAQFDFSCLPSLTILVQVEAAICTSERCFLKFQKTPQSANVLLTWRTPPLPDGVMVARVTLDHLVEVRILIGQFFCVIDCWFLCWRFADGGQVCRLHQSPHTFCHLLMPCL